MNAAEAKKSIHKAILSWYPFEKGVKSLFISDGFTELEDIYEIFADHGLSADKMSLQEINRTDKRYDYIVSAGAIERCMDMAKSLSDIKVHLTKTGKFLAITDNRLGIRYFCGDKDLFTGKVFDGIDGYLHANVEYVGGRAYSLAEWKNSLAAAGFDRYQIYGVFPSIFEAQMLLGEGYCPNETLQNRIMPFYKNPKTIFLEEERLYQSLADNHMLHQMANGFLIETGSEAELTRYDQITLQGDRNQDHALATLIQKDKMVLKKPICQNKDIRVYELEGNLKYLREHGVPVVDSKIEDGSLSMPYIKGENAVTFLQNLMREDKTEFLNQLDLFVNYIVNSSDAVPYEEVDWRKFDPAWETRKADDPDIDKWEKLSKGSDEDKADLGVILKKGYFDLVPINCIHAEEGFVFFDQEFCIDNFPAHVMIYRTINFLYHMRYELDKVVPRTELLERYHVKKHEHVWDAYSYLFLRDVRNELELGSYHMQNRRDVHLMKSNRYRMNYNQEEYDRLFNDIFKGARSKELYLFGSGRFAERFLAQFGDYYDITGILDNNPSRQGEKLGDIPIYSPDIVRGINVPYKVFICIKQYEEVLEQLQSMGVENISIYDPRIEYPTPTFYGMKGDKDIAPKKYKIGYCAGVYDLFHIGHVNLFRRAKEQCEYLIVGIVSDEQVVRNKKTKPYFTSEERLEIVKSCRYVDEAFILPMEESDTEDVWRKYHFDVQFSGSDYEDDPVWQAKKAYLQQHDADMVFFPYTQSTSSTRIKEKITTGRHGKDIENR